MCRCGVRRRGVRRHRALSGDEILPAAARRRLFAPHVRIPDSDELLGPGASYYGYGWAVTGTPEGPLAWHNGGNDWSLGYLARRPRDGVLIFWLSNHAYQDGKWDLQDRAEKLTLGIADRVRAEGR